MNTFVTALVSIVLSVMAQFALKAGMSGTAVREIMSQPVGLRGLFTVLTDKFVFGGFCLYGLGAIVWLGVLSKWDVSKAYPMVGLGFTLTAIFGYFMGEQVSVLRMIGILLVFSGVLIIGKT